MKDIKVNQDKLKILKVKDKTDALTVNHTLFNIPIRCLLVSRSGNGKNTVLSNILMNSNFGYSNIFKGDDIYIFSPHPDEDAKMQLLIKFYDIPENNIYSGDTPDLDAIEHVYLELKKEAVEDKKKKPLIIIDDYSSSGAFSSKYNILTKIFSNSRKFRISIFFLSQYYLSVSPSIRCNANVLIIGNTSNKNLKVLSDENNFLKDNKTFYEMFRAYTKEQFEFFTINYTNNYDNLYLDSNFKPIIHSQISND